MASSSKKVFEGSDLLSGICRTKLINQVVKSVNPKRLRLFAGDLGIDTKEWAEITAPDVNSQDNQKHLVSMVS